jgi:peptidoglycan/LPS O-acetylase OafA/YrhL
MSVLHPAWALLPWGLAMLTIGLIARWAPQADAPGRFAAIDGLRGHLAFGVFLHHGVIWHGWLRTGTWVQPPSVFFTQLGQSSVAVFFMVTAFLFTAKLLDGRERPIDWLRLYVSRVLRLTPLYFVAMAALFTLCGVLTGWQLRVPAAELSKALWLWLSFTIGKDPDINGLPDTFVLMAGVTWSLPCEWLFYLLLPGLALAMRRPAPKWLALLAFVGALGIWSHHKQVIMLLAFAVGGAAAWLVRQDRFCQWAQHRAAPWVVLLMVGHTVATQDTAYAWPPILALGLAFALVAGGCTLFGALTSRLSRRLGDLGYGIYLLHGLLLFTVLHFVVGERQAAQWSDAQHWALLTALAPLLVALAHAAYHLVEHPAMMQTDRLVGWWRARRT